jgi:hypothetical protein
VTARRAFLAVTAMGGVALFVQSLRMLGVDRMLEGISRVGWGFGAIVVLSGAREVVRTLAWMRTIEGPVQLQFAEAFRARLAGEALSTLLPMGILVGEPAKATQVGGRLPFATAFSALAVEFAFYCGSLALLLGAGAGALVAAHQIPLSAVLSGAAAAVVIARYFRGAFSHVSHAGNAEGPGSRVANVMARALSSLQRLRDLVGGFASRHPEHLWPIAAFEVTFQLLAVAEVYVTLLLISPERPTLASAVVLETVSRAITMTFKVLPMRLGVDEAGASLFAGRLHLGAPTGVTLALVRKLRMLVWSAVGLVCFIQRSSDVSTRSPVRVREHPERPYATLERHSVTALDRRSRVTS